ncbi:MAG: DUF1501 domain-containing protein [Planctomycetota bacterium]|nr:DUF1501 domain-containing protein [Planctomycetota bacterium]
MHQRTGCAEYDMLSRRRFLAASSGAALAAASAPAWLPRVALARDYRGAQRDVLISIYLRGASDGLSLVPPHADANYYSLRPTLNVPRPGSNAPSRAIDLDGFFGLAPAMAPLLPAYQDGNLLIVHACGSTDTTRSHFEAQRLMETASSTATASTTGWLGRHIQSVQPMDPGALLRAVAIDSALPQTLIGAPRTLPIPDLDAFGLSGYSQSSDQREAVLRQLYGGSGGGRLAAVASDTLSTIDLLDTINFAGYVPGNAAVYPGSSFGVAMRSAAALIKARVGVEAIAIDVEGWDTHSNQGTTGGFLASLMTTLAQGLAAFYTDMGAGAAPSYTLVCMSEFGRRAAENGSAGTDHGRGNAMFVMGGCVRGGRVLADWPGLAPEQLYERLDLDVTIDYRDILAEILSTRLGNQNLQSVFPGFTPTTRSILSC